MYCAKLRIMATNDYILITDSTNMDDNKDDEDEALEGVETSKSSLEGQGIFLDQEDPEFAETQPQEMTDDFSEKLKELGGIEIIPSDDTDTSY